MSVATKLHRVLQETGPMGKDKRVQGAKANYAYLSEEKLTAELHEVFAKVGLVIIPISMAIADTREDTTSAGNLMHNARIIIGYRLIDPEDGDTLDGMALGEGSDSGDKVLNKCMTAAYKYFLRQIAMISTGDDPDHQESHETASSRPAVHSAPPAPRSAAQPSGSGEARVVTMNTAGGNSEAGSFIMVAGKHQGKRLDEIPRDYVEWLAAKSNFPDSKNAAIAYLNWLDDVPTGEGEYNDDDAPPPPDVADPFAG